MKRSFIVYTKDSSKYIDKLICSILEQMKEEDELIIIDDMSTDETIPIIVSRVGLLWQDEKHYKLYINTSKKGKRASIEMGKKLATNEFKFIINKKKRINLGG